MPHAVAITGAVIFSVSVVALSRVIAWTTDNLIVPGLDGDGVSNNRLAFAFALIIAVALLRGVGAIIRRYFLAMAEYRTQGTWRGQLFDQYINQPLAFHRRLPTGQLLAHVDNDLTVAGIVLKPLAFAVATVVLAVLAVISLALLHPLFGLVAVVVLPILALINQMYTSRVSGPAAAVQQAVAGVSNVAHESFDGIMMVKTLGRSEDEVQRMEAASNELRFHRLRVGRIRAVFEPLLDTLPSVGVVVLLLIGARLVDNGELSVGDVIGAMTLFTVLSLPVRILGFFLQAMPPSVVALERIDKILDIELPPRQVGEVAELSDGPLSLRFEDVWFSHDDHVVLDGLNLDIAAGESIALVGATGSGKTTMLEIATGLVGPDSGQLFLDGVPYGNLAPSARSNRLAMVFQESFLFAESIAENITLGQAARPGAVERAARQAQAHDFILETPAGYETIVGERGTTLSGGQRQRVALARALFRSPSVLLLDDATAAVDPTVEAAILDGLRDEAGATLLIVAHRLSTIVLADRVAFMADGQIAAIGSHEELLSRPDYRLLVQAYEETPTP
jgi:ATP-binding cassette subfamily B protein